MNKAVLVFTTLLFLSFSLQAQNRYLKKLESKVKNRLERKADQKVDKGLDKIEESLEKKAETADEAEEAEAGGQATGTIEGGNQKQVEDVQEEEKPKSPKIFGAKKKQKPLDRNPDLSFGEEENPAVALYEKLEIGDQRAVYENPATYPDKKRYTSKSGKIEIARVVVNPSVTIETRETLYYDEWGWKEARLIYERQNVSMLGFKQVNESYKLAIMDGENLATVDLENLKGGLSQNPAYEDLTSMTRQQEQQFAKGVTEGMDAKTVYNGTEEVAGKTGEVNTSYVFMQEGDTMMVTRLVQWKNIVVKSDSDGMNSIIKEKAFEINEGAIPSKIFYLPKKANLMKFSTKGMPDWGQFQNKN